MTSHHKTAEEAYGDHMLSAPVVWNGMVLFLRILVWLAVCKKTPEKFQKTP